MCDIDTIREAYRLARHSRGHTRGVIEFEKDLERNLLKVQALLLTGRYRSSDYRQFSIIDKGKKRRISALPFYPDRVVHWALILTTRHIFMRNFIATTYAALPGKGTHSALKDVKRALRDPKAAYVLKMDVHHCFESIDKGILYDMVERRIKDPSILGLFHEIIFGYPDKGLPIGNLTSQYLANLYLSGLDHFMKERYHCRWYFRYMDDIVILGWSKTWLHRVRKKIARILSELHMSVNGNWHVAPVSARGVDFVGYRMYPTFILLRQDTKQRMKRRTGRILAQLNSGMPYDVHMEGTISAYHGILSWCDGFRLHDRYITPISRRIQDAESKRQ